MSLNVSEKEVVAAVDHFFKYAYEIVADVARAVHQDREDVQDKVFIQLTSLQEKGLIEAGPTTTRPLRSLERYRLVSA